ncbi:MAG: hypothetical protein ACRETF_02065 [Nevskiaceae bacterium]
MKLVGMILGGLAALVVLVLGLWTVITLNYTYSSGERAGYVQKISQRGWICKTWEGEIAMANLPGAMPQIFEFSVRDDAVAAEIQKLAGQRVSLTYDEHPGIPTSCFGDTDYFIIKVTPITDAMPLPATPPAPQP